MKIDNAVVHFCPCSPYIVKCCVNLRQGKRIVLRVPLSDVSAAGSFLARTYPKIPVKLYTHFCNEI